MSTPHQTRRQLPAQQLLFVFPWCFRFPRVISSRLSPSTTNMRCPSFHLMAPAFHSTAGCAWTLTYPGAPFPRSRIKYGDDVRDLGTAYGARPECPDILAASTTAAAVSTRHNSTRRRVLQTDHAAPQLCCPCFCCFPHCLFLRSLALRFALRFALRL